MSEHEQRAATPCVVCWSDTDTLIRGGEAKIMAALTQLGGAGSRARGLMTKHDRVWVCETCASAAGVRVYHWRSGSGQVHFRRVAAPPKKPRAARAPPA